MSDAIRVYPVTEINTVDVVETPVEVHVDGNNQTVESTTQDNPVTINMPDVQIYTAGIQGPPGVAEEDVAYAKRIDFEDNETVIYKGEADPGTLDSAGTWRIRRLTLNAESDVTEEWADGNADFDNVWSDHLTLTYS